MPKEFQINGDEVRIRKQGTALILDHIASDWKWLDDIVGKFSKDFYAGGRDQPQLPADPKLDTMFE